MQIDALSGGGGADQLLPIFAPNSDKCWPAVNV
jgi:hypothetical protein